jgi:mono/diheme cytochrome c family protein
MRRGSFARAALLALVTLSLVQAAEPGRAEAGNTAQAGQSGPEARARVLWRRHCGPCHLEGGTGTFMLGRRLGTGRALLEQRTDLNAPYVRTVVRNGIQSMPRFSRAELPDADLERIVQYLVR